MSFPIAIAIGIGAGILAGLFGVGGGLIIIPALVFIGRYSQIEASGTSLAALSMPIGLVGAITYFHAGKINMTNVKVGLLISLGMFLGSYFGARIALGLPDYILKRAFAVFLVFVAVRLWLMTMSKT